MIAEGVHYLPDDPPEIIRDVLIGEERDILLVGHMPSIPAIARLLSGDPQTAFPLHGLVALERGDRDRATALATTIVSGDRDLLDVVIPAWFGDPEAVDALGDLARRRPQDLVVQDWAGRVAARSLDPAATGTYRRIADISLYPFSGIGSETRLVPPGDPRAGGDITIYGAFLYRRPTPYNMLPASLVGLRNA